MCLCLKKKPIQYTYSINRQFIFCFIAFFGKNWCANLFYSYKRNYTLCSINISHMTLCNLIKDKTNLFSSIYTDKQEEKDEKSMRKTLPIISNITHTQKKQYSRRIIWMKVIKKFFYINNVLLLYGWARCWYYNNATKYFSFDVYENYVQDNFHKSFFAEQKLLGRKVYCLILRLWDPSHRVRWMNFRKKSTFPWFLKKFSKFLNS